MMNIGPHPADPIVKMAGAESPLKRLQQSFDLFVRKSRTNIKDLVDITGFDGNPSLLSGKN